MHGPRVEHRRIIGARKKIDRKKSWRSDLKILRSHLKTLRSSWYVTRKWEGGIGDSKNVNSDTWTITVPKGSSGELIAAENGPPECGCPDPLRNRSPGRRGLQISFHQQSLELTGIREVGIPVHIFPTFIKLHSLHKLNLALVVLGLRRRQTSLYPMQFSTEKRFTASTSPQNDVFASKSAPGVALCVGIVICVLSHSGRCRAGYRRDQKSA